jgi:hypothetical protein
MTVTRTGGWVQEIKVDHGAQWPHNGNRYGGPDDVKPLSKRLPAASRTISIQSW